MKVNKVLMPIDRSAFSLTILPSIEQFLLPAQNALIFFHVAEEPILRGMSEAESTETHKKLHDGLQTEVALELQPLTDLLRAKGYAVAVEVVFGEPVPAIERFIAQRKIDLLAMTTHGRSGLGRVLFGSVAQQLLLQLNIPILIFHPSTDNESVNFE